MDEDETLRIRYAVGLPAEVVRRARIRLGEGLTGAAALEQTTIVVDDVTRDPRYISALDSVRSELAVPLLARGKTIGSGSRTIWPRPGASSGTCSFLPARDSKASRSRLRTGRFSR